jgi:glutamate 5-kinase
MLKIMGLKSSQIEQALGYKDYDEAIHRDNLAVTVQQNSKAKAETQG